MTEFDVHRVRIGDWVPSPIKSIASDLFSTKIAIGREDGDIEICDSSSKWYSQARFPGQTDFKLQSLVWSSIKSEQGRLFGVSLRGFIYEVDLSTLKIKNVRDSYGGAVWCVAASRRSATIAIGCDDGAVRLYRYDGGSGNSLEYHKTLPTSGSRIVSIAYHPVEPLLYIGCSDGTVRCMDESTGRVNFRMTGDVLKGSTTAVVIWSLLVLSDSTVVTGDNRGHVQIWDGVTGVLMSTYRQHTADVLALVTNHDESSIFASGVDGKVVCIQKTLRDKSDTDSDAGPADNDWVYTHSHRAHSHDVYTLSLCFTPNASAANKSRPEPGSPLSSNPSTAGHWILLSGGLDTKVCTYSATNFIKVRPSWIPAVPANTLVSHSKNYDVVTLRHSDHVDIWHVAMLTHTEQFRSDSEETSSACQLKLRIQTKGSEHIHASAVSNDGQYVAISSTSGLRLWRIVQQTADADEGDKKSKKIRTKKGSVANNNTSLNGFKMNPTLPVELVSVSVPALMSAPKEFCQALQFSHDSNQLAVYGALTGTLAVFNIIDNKSGTEHPHDSADQTDEEDDASVDGIHLKVAASFDHRRSTGVEEGEAHGLASAVRSIRFSDDNRFVAVMSCAETVYVYDMTHRRLHWRLPRCKDAVTDVQFMHSNTATLVVLTATNNLILFDVVAMKLNAWSEANADKIPKYVRQMAGSLSGIALDPKDSNKLVLYGQGYCVLVRLNEKIPVKPKLVTQATTALMQKSLQRKRKAARYENSNSSGHLDEDDVEIQKKVTIAPGAADESDNFLAINIYRNLLHIGCKDANQLVVIENPWLRTIETLPAAIDRKRYGT